MRTLLLIAIGISLIQLLYVSLEGLSSPFAKYNYCYDVVQAAKYNLPKPDFTEYGLKLDFTEYGLKSAPECKQ